MLSRKRKFLLFPLILLIILTGNYTIMVNKNINDIGLSLLQCIKKIKGEEVDVAALETVETAIIAHSLWDALLKKHVALSGSVDYKGFMADKNQLQQYLDLLSNNPPAKNWSTEDQLAYWINAYNAFTVKLIIDHYPVQSIKKIDGTLPIIKSPWDIKFFKIGGIDFDLNTIEHVILRKQFEEPRIHFAINCASVSCPNLRKEAFTAAVLETQLEEQATIFINNPIKNKISKDRLQLSPLFDWFKSDFTKEQDLLAFLQPYTTVSLHSDIPLEYLDYDWNLNEVAAMNEATLASF